MKTLWAAAILSILSTGAKAAPISDPCWSFAAAANGSGPLSEYVDDVAAAANYTQATYGFFPYGIGPAAASYCAKNSSATVQQAADWFALQHGY